MANGNANGTAGAPNGHLFAEGLYCHLESGATYWSANSCSELDLGNDSGSSVNYSYGSSVVLLSSNAVAPSIEEMGYDINAQADAVPTISCGFCVGTYSGFNPLAASASIMKWTNHAGGEANGPTITNGIHLSAFTFSNHAFDSPGFAVLPSGAVSTATLEGTTAGNAVAVGGDPTTYNQFLFTPGAAGVEPKISTVGVDANQQLVLQGHGVSGISLRNGSNVTSAQFGVDGTGGNFWDFHGTGTVVYVLPSGTSTNVGVLMRAKGAGSVSLLPDNVNGLTIANGGAVTASSTITQTAVTVASLPTCSASVNKGA